MHHAITISCPFYVRLSSHLSEDNIDVFNIRAFGAFENTVSNTPPSVFFRKLYLNPPVSQNNIRKNMRMRLKINLYT